MKIVKIDNSNADKAAKLVADFRVILRSYKGIRSQPDIGAGREEIIEFLKTGFPLFAVEDNDKFVGYIACRIDEPCLWVEHIYVCEEFRRKGAASLLFEKAEEIARSMGEDTVFNSHNLSDSTNFKKGL